MSLLRTFGHILIMCFVASSFAGSFRAYAQQVPLQALGRFEGWRDNQLIGYGLVTGLAGTGDTRRSEVTRQALKNVLSRLGTSVTEEQINSRNVAVVIVTGTLPASANSGDRIDANVSSVGDARSLAGGTLLMTPLMGPDQRAYALAQGPITVGGYDFEANFNREQRNFPTSGTLSEGATVERAVDAQVAITNGTISFLLKDPSFTTANRIASEINDRMGGGLAYVHNADEVRIRAGSQSGLPELVARIQNLSIVPDVTPRVVINERTGTVVAGGNVTISSVSISQGDIKVSVRTDNYASQPSFIYGFASDVESLVVSNTEITVEDGRNDISMTFPASTVAELTQGLSRAGVDTRRIIAILQGIKATGALHADIIVQ